MLLCDACQAVGLGGHHEAYCFWVLFEWSSVVPVVLRKIQPHKIYRFPAPLRFFKPKALELVAEGQ